MVGKSTLLQVTPQKSTQNAANLQLQTCEKNQWSFLVVRRERRLNPRNNLANLGSFAKVSVLLQFLIPWYALFD